MKKYDCSKTLDYAHELDRMCDTYNSCCEGDRVCPLRHQVCSSSVEVSQEKIDIVQKWSDEHPEPPKLTKKERTFLECFKGFPDKRVIRRTGWPMYCYNESTSYLQPDLFTFIEDGYSMTFEELLELEVEE